MCAAGGKERSTGIKVTIPFYLIESSIHPLLRCRRLVNLSTKPEEAAVEADREKIVLRLSVVYSAKLCFHIAIIRIVFFSLMVIVSDGSCRTYLPLGCFCA